MYGQRQILLLFLGFMGDWEFAMSIWLEFLLYYELKLLLLYEKL